MDNHGQDLVSYSDEDRNKEGSRPESKVEYWDRLNKSVKDIERGEGIMFTMAELEAYVSKMA